MRTLTVAVLIGVTFFVTAGMVYAANTITKKAGEYTVDVTIDRNPPVAGKNNADIALKDKAGKAVIDAKVVVEYSMAAMPGMPAVNYKATAELKGDRYKAVIEPSMAGPWNVAIKINRGGKMDTAKLTLDVK